MFHEGDTIIARTQNSSKPVTVKQDGRHKNVILKTLNCHRDNNFLSK